MTEAKQSYTEPVSRLMGLGDVRKKREWPDYLALGISEQDVPELSRMILDKELFFADSNSDEVWSGLHAWRALAQLEAESAIPALIELLSRVDEYGDDWTSEELPLVFAHIGRAAIEPLRTFLANASQGKWSRVAAGNSLARIGERHPELRAEAVAALQHQLEKFEQQDANFNGLLIGNLIDLKGVEAAPVIEQAFVANKVDVLIQGDWEDVQVYLGLLDKRKTPAPDHRALMAAQMGLDPELFLNLIQQQSQADRAQAQLKAERKAEDKAKAKAKAKRKQAKQSQKKQRKRK